MRRQYARLAAACACAVATAVFCGAALAGGGSSANAPGQLKQEQAAAQPPAAQPAEQQATQQATPRSEAPGQVKKQETAPVQPTQQQAAAQPSAHSAPGQAKQEAKASTSSAGVKPASTTTHWTHCTTGGSASAATCTSSDGGHTPQAKADVSKQYGNGKTAAQIAVSRGGVDVQLTGPGNSQPHKVSACGKPSNRSGGVDVHAVKSYDASACQQQAPQAAPQVTQVETHVCGQTTLTTTSTQVAGVLHHDHLMTNTHSAHFTKHGDEAVVVTTQSTQVVPTGESCTSAQTSSSTSVSASSQTSSSVSVSSSASSTAAASNAPATASTSAPSIVAAAPAAPASNAGVLGAQASLGTATSSAKPHGGVLGTVTKVAGSTLPFTGFPLWIAVVLAIALILAGAALTRRRGVGARQ